MGRNTTTIPHAASARILAASGLRVSDDAAQLLSSLLNDKALAIAKKAAEIAAHAKRKTVNFGDVMLASK